MRGLCEKLFNDGVNDSKRIFLAIIYTIIVLYLIFIYGDIMDKRKGILNISVSLAFKVVTMVVVVIVKRFLIRECGNDVNGLNSLYLSIIGLLSIAELGVGSAITFCMYKPIVEGDTNKVSALYQLFNRLYLIIGGIIFAVGIGVTPFIKYLAKDYSELNVDFYLTFFMMLVSVVLTYLYASKTALINAHKNNYVTTVVSSSCLLLQYVLQIIVLLITKSFVWYLACRIVSAIVGWIITEIIARRKYPHILSNKSKLDGETKTEVVKKSKAMFMHKIGGTLVNTVNSVVISAFVGVVMLGKYSNYSMIMTSLSGILMLVFTSLTSVIGHFCVESNKETVRKYSDAFHLLNFMIGQVFLLGYYAIIDNLVAVLFAPDLIMAKSVAVVVTINGFIQFMRQSTFMFRDATGTFYNDRWKPLFEGILNLVLSLLLVQKLGVIGVIVATIITNLVICHIVEPYVLYKNVFHTSPKKHYLRNYGMMILFALTVVAQNLCAQNLDNNWTELLVNGFISVGISGVACLIVAIFNKKLIFEMLFKLRKRR